MIYLDNASTTKPSKKATEAFLDACENFGNPSSLHKLGLNSEKIINKSKEQIASVLGISAKDIYFTSGGTEANNMAILGYCRANKKRANEIITTAVEHPSVMSPFKILAEEGFYVTYLGVDRDGRIDLNDLEAALSDKTLFVSVMAANNEVGTIMPIDKIKSVMKKKAPNSVLHVDAVQAFGKIPLKPAAWGIDMMSLSSHKIHGVKGCGALYTSTERLKPLLYGGGQQKELRAGTENVPGIAAFGAAVSETNTDNSEMLKARAILKEKIAEKIDNVTFNGSDEFQTGYVLNVSFKGIKAEILLHMLETKEIYVSTGSACSSHKPMPSHVLTAMGVDAENIKGAVRISFCEPISEEEAEKVSQTIAECVAEVRKYVR